MHSDLRSVFLLLFFDVTKLDAQIIHLLIQQSHFVLEGVFYDLSFRVAHFPKLGHFVHLFIDSRHMVGSLFYCFLVCDVSDSL
jgi:hypothetical protein